MADKSKRVESLPGESHCRFIADSEEVKLVGIKSMDTGRDWTDLLKKAINAALKVKWTVTREKNDGTEEERVCTGKVVSVHFDSEERTFEVIAQDGGKTMTVGVIYTDEEVYQQKKLEEAEAIKELEKQLAALKKRAGAK